MSTTSSEGGRRYKRLPPPKQQKTFGTRRTTRKTISSIPALPKKQSSLTQLWDNDRPNPTIELSSGEDDSDYEERPAKKQKTSAKKESTGKKSKFGPRGKDQGSFTQFPYLKRMAEPLKFDRDGFQIWQHSDTEEDVEGRSSVQHSGHPVPPARYLNGELEDDLPEILASSQNTSHEEKQQEKTQSETVKGRIARLCTPQKVRFVEVPSSHTPPSTRPSTKRPGLRNRSTSRSPLKERSVNARSPTKTPSPAKSSQSPLKRLPSPDTHFNSLQMLERVRFANQRRAREAKFREKEYDDLLQCAAEATDEFSLRTCPMRPPPPRSLQRKTTIQDSQADSLDAIVTLIVDGAAPKLTRAGTIADSQRNSSNVTLVEESQVHPPRRSLKRVATIQDSQDEDSDLELDDHAASVAQHDNNDELSDYEAGDQQQDDDFGECTYDPAFSALDRDATRFEWTQMQKGPTAVDEDGERGDEDLVHDDTSNSPAVRDSPCAEDAGGPAQPSAPGSAPKDGREPGSEPNAHKGTAPISTSGDDEGLRDDSAYQPRDQVSGLKDVHVPSSPPPPLIPPGTRDRVEATEDMRVPSSPPPLRLSQVSTVVPTQMSMPPAASSPQKKIKPEPFSQPPTPRHLQKSRPFSVLSSPYRQNSLWRPESLSSSPLPLPPWSSPEKHGSIRHSREEGASLELESDVQVDSLADFSLPPPPPLSSSRRGTPASSSL